MAAVRAVEAGEAGGEVAAAVEGLDDGNGRRIERAVGGPVAGFVTGQEVGPRMVDDLPEERGAGAAGFIDIPRKECS